MIDRLRHGPASRAFHWKLLFLWLLLSAVLLAISWRAIVTRTLPDGDDHMRLQQVRDLLAGQSWFDTTQYRMNPPAGAPMHWSRVVDIPLVLLLLPLRALLGQATAEIVTMCAVPLITFGCALGLTAHLVRRFVGETYALVAAVLLPMLSLFWVQIEPLRIDHHGWQIVLGIAAAAALFLPQARRSGMLAAAAVALWMAISIEGLPFAAAIGTLLAVRWVLDESEGTRLQSYLWTLAGAATATLLATRGTEAWRDIHCDALTYPYVLAVTISAAGVSIAAHLPFGRTARAASLAIAAALAAAALGTAAPLCLNGPFAALDPLVHDYWYVRIAEGLPVWRQTPAVAILVLGYPLIGLAGAAWGWSNADAAERRDWATMLTLLASAIAIGIMVQRGAALASVLALPGAMYALRRALPAARAIRSAVPRSAATVAVILLLSPWLPEMIGPRIEALLAPPKKAGSIDRQVGANCASPANLARLNMLPPANLLTPLDMAAPILTETHHRLLASGHHRNQAAMKDEILIFSGPVERAHRIIETRHIDYVVACPFQAEPTLLRSIAPHGFWSRLSSGAPLDWLKPVPLANAQTLLVWRVKRP